MTPPLHYGCRSVLVPVDTVDMEALRRGDPAVERRIFRYQPPGAPQSLEQAMDGWKDAPRPPSGFGDLGRGGGPPRSGKGGGVSEPPGGTRQTGEDGEERRTPWVRGEKRRNIPVSFFENSADGRAFLEQQQKLRHSGETFDGKLLKVNAETLLHVNDEHAGHDPEERLIQVPAIWPMVQSPYGILTITDLRGPKSLYFGTIDAGEDGIEWLCVILREQSGLIYELDTWFTIRDGLRYIDRVERDAKKSGFSYRKI